MSMPSSLSRSISPPPRLSKRQKTPKETFFTDKQDDDATARPSLAEPTLAAVEAGRVKLENHLVYFREHLSKARRTVGKGEPRIGIDEWADLYERNQHEYGNHFVVHQHNHPISGVHYDLRLQFSPTSSLSFAIPKGLPGNPNSRSLGRMAIETRVHNLWNHLIESASFRTGSLLIWDTGTYTVLPRKNDLEHPPSPQTTEGDDSDIELYPTPTSPSRSRRKVKAEHEKLIQAFQTRHIRLRLNGVRLPENYTVTLRLPYANDVGKRPLFSHRRKRANRHTKAQPQSTDSEPEEVVNEKEQPEDIDTDEDEDAQTRLNNAYPGSKNTIGSIHQRQWFMLLDRASSGFVQDKGSRGWVRRSEGQGFEPFFVRGRDHERSVVTGRLAREVESDEGVEEFVGRSGWTGIMH